MPKMPVEIVALSNIPSGEIQRAIDIANSVQDQFDYMWASQEIVDALKMLDFKFVEASEILDQLDQLKTGSTGYHPFVISFVTAILSNDQWTNLFGEHRGDRGVAVVSTANVADVILPKDRFAAYFLYYFARYTISFLDPKISNHDETKGCLFDHKTEKRDILESMRRGAICDSCRRLMTGGKGRISPAQYEALNSLLEAADEVRNSRVVASMPSRQVELKHDFDLAVVTALQHVEFESLMRLDWNWRDRRQQGDGTHYKEGTVVGANGAPLRVVAASCPRPGMPAAATLAMKITQHFRPRYLAMIGISAGVRDRTNFGDVLAADPCWDYGSGKWYIENGERKFDPAPYQIPLQEEIRGALHAMAADAELWNKIRQGWQGHQPESVIRLLIGPVASGAAVQQDPGAAKAIMLQHRQLIGIEMEAYGVYAAAETSPQPKPIYLSLKSVCDFADEHKSDEFQRYAAYTSTQALRHLVEQYFN